jgi:hypothetical protein
MTKENILQAADRLTSVDRRQEYGSPGEEFERVAAMLSALLKKKLKEPITAEEMALCMILLKITRYSYKQSRDSLVDLCGYARTIEMLTEDDGRTIQQEQFDLAMKPLTDTMNQMMFAPYEGGVVESAEMGKAVLEGICIANNRVELAPKTCPSCKRCTCDKCADWHAERCEKPLSWAEPAEIKSELEYYASKTVKKVEHCETGFDEGLEYTGDIDRSKFIEPPKPEYSAPPNVQAWGGGMDLLGEYPHPHSWFNKYQ